MDSLDATLLGRAATVVRDRRDVGNAGDLQTTGIQRAHRGFTTGAGATDADFDVLHAVLLRRDSRLLSRHLRRERRRLARTAEAATTRRRPGKRVSLAVGDRDDGVVEGSVHVGDAVEDVLARLLRFLRTTSGSGTTSGGTRSSGF